MSFEDTVVELQSNETTQTPADALASANLSKTQGDIRKRQREGDKTLKGRSEGKTCFFCGRAGHYQSGCRDYLEAKERIERSHGSIYMNDATKYNPVVAAKARIMIPTPELPLFPKKLSKKSFALSVSRVFPDEKAFTTRYMDKTMT